MKKFFLTLSFLNILWAQFTDPAQFTVNIEDVNQGEVAIIDVNAELDFTWRIYAVYNVPEGPSPTKFIIKSDIVNKSGKVIEPEPIEKFDEGFSNITKYHEGSPQSVSYTHLRAHETCADLVCRLLLEKKNLQ